MKKEFKASDLPKEQKNKLQDFYGREVDSPELEIRCVLDKYSYLSIFRSLVLFVGCMDLGLFLLCVYHCGLQHQFIIDDTTLILTYITVVLLGTALVYSVVDLIFINTVMKKNFYRSSYGFITKQDGKTYLVYSHKEKIVVDEINSIRKLNEGSYMQKNIVFRYDKKNELKDVIVL